MSELHVVILAAGKGTRMKSDLPKVVCEIGGRPLIQFVLDATFAAGIMEAIAHYDFLRACRVPETDKAAPDA